MVELVDTLSPAGEESRLAKRLSSSSNFDYRGSNPLLNTKKLKNFKTMEWFEYDYDKFHRELVTGQKYIPKEITIDSDNNDVQIASFDYYSGLAYAKELNLKQTSMFHDVLNKTHFIVCCGDVMIKVEPTDFESIPRRRF